MIRVKIILLDEVLRKRISEKEVVFELPEGSTIKDLLESAEKLYGEAFKDAFRPEVSIMLNGQNIEFLGGFNAKVADGDRVAIVPIVAGG
ncbi:MAG: MoaD/ThiS family protein [Candidatus Bathyarchaeia archaeon]